MSGLTPLERAQERMARASFDHPLPRRPGLTVVDRLARLGMILEADAIEGDGLRATVDLPRLARLSRASIRRTRRAIRCLEELGAIRVRGRDADGRLDVLVVNPAAVPGVVGDAA